MGNKASVISQVANQVQNSVQTMQQSAPATSQEQQQAAPAAAAPQCQPGEVATGKLIVENAAIKIGVDPTRGAGIFWLSKGGSPDNLLNEYDCGRFIQQSYYGRQDGSDWNGKPWSWNPVQCGSWQNRPARVLECSKKGNCIVTQVNPRNWAGQQLCDDVWMRADISLVGKHADLKFTVKHDGCDDHPVRIQELPAVFLSRKLGQLVFYDGPEPWQGKTLTIKQPGQVNENYRITENWAAYIDPTTGEGVGIYTPVAQTITCYRVGKDGSNACSDCSYVAPTMRFALKPGFEMTYHAFITIGTVEEIRKEFSDIRGWAVNKRPEMLASPALAGATPAI
ncbi:hypothetical protein COO60DRAFT_1549570 [Scenedesmus sp. NREL 46B-D3]|nr:hypothetical protein COO60DRAFT_1549570 [Scenedesmus sp. NREL 46B-D3]